MTMPTQHKIARWPLLLITLLLGAFYVSKISNERRDSKGIEEISASARATELSEGAISGQILRKISASSAHRIPLNKPRAVQKSHLTHLKEVKLPWYEEVLQKAMQEETSQTEISDPALSNAVAFDHKRSATAAVHELSDTWSARNPFETEPFAYCDQLRDLSLRERRACFNNYLSTVPGFHKIENQTAGLDACKDNSPALTPAQLAKQDQGCMAFLRRQALSQQFDACACVMAGSCKPHQFETCNAFKEAMGKINSMLLRQGQFDGAATVEDAMRQQEAEANATAAKEAKEDKEEEDQAKADREREAETDRSLAGMNETLKAGLAKSKQEAEAERSVMGWLEGSLDRLGLIRRNASEQIVAEAEDADADAAGGANATAG
eukprot:CAMPEP_0172186116 /NCGR_PEP_ID=MMETSP1050-20130122/20565_1 /TAXON_ID=233186 /ORGANISM="Cryptomonas curvata, Strain CCAP979/52" /LENGTH=379 /DNA_ID=CAMNT_0012860215 /DNA_START=26 /DNA_END=1161 /DNA_ORIENTATION=+